MIKVKDLVPGRVVTTIEHKFIGLTGWRDTTTAWLIIGFTEQIRRRHNQKQAPRDGWHVLMLSFGGKMQTFHITPGSMHNFKRLF